MKEKTQVILWAAVASVLGLISIIAPVFILSPRRYASPLFPWVRSGIEGLSLLSALFLFLSGIALGAAYPKRWFLVGACTMAGFPLLAFLEMLADSTSHNLWPLEFVMYGFISLVAVAGAFIGRLLYRLTHSD